MRLLNQAKRTSKGTAKRVANIVDNCICKKLKPTPPVPNVAFPKATTTNEVVSLDVKEVIAESAYILYMLDEYSRYTKGVIIEDKNPETTAAVPSGETGNQLKTTLTSINRE